MISKSKVLLKPLWRAWSPKLVSRTFARKVIKKPESISKSSIEAVPPPAEDPWVPVTDKTTGQIYYWNTKTNETTAIGEPKPVGLQPPNPSQPPSVLGGLGSVVAEGFAFGIGSSVARSVVNSMFGGSSSSGSESVDDDDVI